VALFSTGIIGMDNPVPMYYAYDVAI
jgi:hypothetical protein